MKKFVCLSILFYFLLPFVVCTAAEENGYRLWLSADGRGRIDNAKFLKANEDGQTIVLEKKSGELRKMALEDFSMEDQKFIKDFVEAEYGKPVRETMERLTEARKVAKFEKKYVPTPDPNVATTQHYWANPNQYNDYSTYNTFRTNNTTVVQNVVEQQQPRYYPQPQFVPQPQVVVRPQVVTPVMTASPRGMPITRGVVKTVRTK